MDEKARQKIQDLQILEQNLQAILMQKQNISMEMSEIANALSEIDKTNDKIYKMVGSIMIAVDKVKTIQELEEKKKILELRGSTINKQEKSIESRVAELHSELKKVLENTSTTSK